MWQRLRQRNEWGFFAALTRAAPGLSIAWWLVLLVRGVTPALFAIAMGRTVAAVQAGDSLTGPLVVIGTVFVIQQVIGPLQTAISQNLGNRLSDWLNEGLIAACLGPPGIGHLEDPSLTEDLVVAREFDRGQTAPPMYLNVEFVAQGLQGVVSGVASAAVLASFSWWSALILLLAWASTHWLLRESGVWKDRNTPQVRAAQRDADYAYRLSVDPLPAKELRLFGLAGWTVDRFIDRRKTLYELQYAATRLREKSVALCLLIVFAGNALVFGALGLRVRAGEVDLDQAVVFALMAVNVSLVAFGGLSWALDDAASPVAAVARLGPAMASAGALADPVWERAASAAGTPSSSAGPAAPLAVALRDVSFHYPGSSRLVFDGLDLELPAGSSLAVVGQNGAGKTTLAKLLCRLYDPTTGAIEADGVDLRTLDIAAWRGEITAVFQDFVRLEWSLRRNVDPASRSSDEQILAALADAGADRLTDLDTILAKGYPGGTDLSGGQWQRVALARALCAVRRGARLVLLDEPTAQLDVRGEATVFDRVLAATAGVTTVLISHRFSTVRHVDRICVLEGGRVIELGSHEELMHLNGRYRTMFDLQAKRFDATMDEEGAAFDVL